jgi:hypothetical protein
MEQAWKEAPNGATLQTTWATLHRVAASLAQWGKDTFGSVRKKIHKLERHFEKSAFGAMVK